MEAARCAARPQRVSQGVLTCRSCRNNNLRARSRRCLPGAHTVLVSPPGAGFSDIAESNTPDSRLDGDGPMLHTDDDLPFSVTDSQAWAQDHGSGATWTEGDDSGDEAGALQLRLPDGVAEVLERVRPLFWAALPSLVGFALALFIGGPLFGKRGGGERGRGEDTREDSSGLGPGGSERRSTGGERSSGRGGPDHHVDFDDARRRGAPQRRYL